MAITLRTDKQGLAIIDRARVKKNWTALAIAWCNQANVSISTLKRFRERKAIQKDAFISICRAVGINDWQQITADSTNEVSVLQRKCRQSKRVIAEEVLSNLDSLDARLKFVAQIFSDDPAEAQAQMERLQRKSENRQAADGTCSENPNLTPLCSHYPLKIEANVSIIQIMMEV